MGVSSPLSNPLVKISIPPPLSHPSLHTYVLKVPKRRGGVDYIAYCKLRTAKTFALKLAINRSSGILTPLIPENAYVLCTLLLPASPALLALQSDANCLKKRSQLEFCMRNCRLEVVLFVRQNENVFIWRMIITL